MDRVFPYLSPSYTVTVFNDFGRAFPFPDVSRSFAVSKIQFAKLMGNAYTVDYNGSTLVEPYAVPTCYGCGVRPAQWDMDCDGPYATSECGQCAWWDAVNAREAQEERCAMGEAMARDRAALADLLSMVPDLF